MPLLYRDPSASPAGDYVVTKLASPAPGLLGASADAWRDAAAIDWGPERYRTTFQACWDVTALHVRFDAVDTAPWFTMRTRDAHLWEEEVVEIFLDAEGAGVNYAELEINPANVVCDLRVETARAGGVVRHAVGLGGTGVCGRAAGRRARDTRRLDGGGPPAVGRAAIAVARRRREVASTGR